MIETKRVGNVDVIRMDDGKANALSDAMIGGLQQAIDGSDAGALVIAGRADRFCAGFDLRAMMSGPDAARALVARGAALFMALYGAPRPVVIACTGHALAGGALLVLTGDYRVGARGDYKIGLNEVSIGLPVPVLAVELARDRVTTRELTRATLAARIYAPDDALAAGFLDEVVAPDEVIARATDEAARLAALPRGAYAGTKQRLRGKTIAYILATIDDDMRAFARDGR
jgi:enoyl-CoA hydratase